MCYLTCQWCVFLWCMPLHHWSYLTTMSVLSWYESILYIYLWSWSWLKKKFYISSYPYFLYFLWMSNKYHDELVQIINDEGTEWRKWSPGCCTEMCRVSVIITTPSWCGSIQTPAMPRDRGREDRISHKSPKPVLAFCGESTTRQSYGYTRFRYTETTATVPLLSRLAVQSLVMSLYTSY